MIQDVNVLKGLPMSTRVSKPILMVVLILFSCVAFSQGDTSDNTNAQGTYKKAKKQPGVNDQKQQESGKTDAPKKAKKQDKS